MIIHTSIKTSEAFTGTVPGTFQQTYIFRHSSMLGSAFLRGTSSDLHICPHHKLLIYTSNLFLSSVSRPVNYNVNAHLLGIEHQAVAPDLRIERVQ